MSGVGEGVKGRKNRRSPKGCKGRTEGQGNKGEGLALKKVAPGWECRGYCSLKFGCGDEGE